jgi:hypothetical protein
VLVKAKALQRDAFFQIITSRVINTHFILSQQKGDCMGSDLEEEEAVTTSTMSTTFSIETIFFFWAVTSSDVSQKRSASIIRVNEL